MNTTIKIADVLDSPSALSEEQGEIIYGLIEEAFKKNKSVCLDFMDIESIITPFLNASIGKLYEHHESDYITKMLQIINQPAGTNRKFNLVIKNAKNFYLHKEQFTAIVKEVMSK